MPRGTQLTVCLENKPGQAAKLGAALKRAKVNIMAISVVDNTDTGIVRLVTDASGKARQALTRAGMKPTRQSVLILNLPNEPGALGVASGKLAEAGVNINYAYGSVVKGAAEGTIIFGVDDLGKAFETVRGRPQRISESPSARSRGEGADTRPGAATCTGLVLPANESPPRGNCWQIGDWQYGSGYHGATR